MVCSPTRSKAGLSTTPLVMGILIGNIGSGQLSSRLGKYKGLMLGGLVTSTLLNLFVMPSLYLRFGRRSNHRHEDTTPID